MVASRSTTTTRIPVLVAVAVAVVLLGCICPVHQHAHASSSNTLDSGVTTTTISTNVSFLLGDELSSEVYRRGNVWSLLYAYDPKHPRVINHINELLLAAKGLPALANTISIGIAASSSDESTNDNLASTASRMPSLLQIVITDGVSYYPAEEKPFMELKQQQSESLSASPKIHFPNDIGRGSKDSSGAAVLQELGVDRFPALVLIKDGIPIEAINPEAAGYQVLGRLQAHLENHLDWELLVSVANNMYLPAALQSISSSPDDDDDDSALSASSFNDASNVASPYFADGPGKAAVHNASDLVHSVVVGLSDEDSADDGGGITNHLQSFSGVSSTILVDTVKRIQASNSTQSVAVVPPHAVVDATLRRILGSGGCTIMRPLAGSAGYKVLYGEETEFSNYMFVFAPEAWIPAAIRQGRRDGGDPHGRGKRDHTYVNQRSEEQASEAEETDVEDDDWLSLQRRRYPGYISLTDHELLPGTWLEQLRAAGISVVGVPHYSSVTLPSANTPWWIGLPQQHQSLTASFAGVSTGGRGGPSSVSQSQAFQHSDLQRLAAVALPPVATGSNHLLSFPAISARAPCVVTLFLKETTGETDQSYQTRLKRVASMPLIVRKKKTPTTTGEDGYDDVGEVLTLGDVCTFAVLDADVHSRHYVSFGFLFKDLYRTANELKEAYQMYGRAGTGGRDPSTNIRLKFSDHLVGIQHNNRKFKYPHTVLDVGLVAKYLRKVLSGDAPRSRVSEQHFGVKETDSAVLYGGASQWRPLVYSLPSGDDLLQDGLLDVTRDTLFIMVPNDVLRLCSVFRSTSALPSLVHSSWAGGKGGVSGANVGSMVPTYRLTHTCNSYTTMQEQQRDLFSLAVSKEERRNALVSPTAAQILTDRYGTLLSAIDDVLYKLASVGAGKHMQVFLWNVEQNDWPPFVDPSKFGPTSHQSTSGKTAANAKKKANMRKKKHQKQGSGGVGADVAHKEVSDAGTVKSDDEAALKLAKTLSGYLGRVLTRDSIRIGYVSSRTKFEFISGKSDLVSGPPTMRVLGVHEVSSLHHDEQGVPRYMPISQLSLSTDNKVPKTRLETFLRESSEVISSLLDQEPSFDMNVGNNNNPQQDDSDHNGEKSASESVDEGEF